MSKGLAILLISLHLLGNTEVGQLFKLPQLVRHFFQHHRQDPNIDFLEFIAMHYSGDDGTTADDDIDNQLPCHNFHQNTIAVVYTSMVKEISIPDNTDWKTTIFLSHLSSSTSPKHVSLVLQPPRLG